MIVLGNRECGAVSAGVYAVGLGSPGGTLRKFTAIAAPFDAEVKNPRKAEEIAMGQTLREAWGLHAPTGSDECWQGLPPVGMADLWGRTYYKTVWSAIEETRRMGVCRRIAGLPQNLKTPYPVLMLHMDSFVELGVDAGDVERWLAEHLGEPGDEAPPWSFYADVVGPNIEATYGLFDWAWMDADVLGRIGSDDYMWHSHVGLWSLAPLLKKKRLYSRFLRECEITLSQGVFGLAWITHYVQVLRQDQDDVDPKLKSQGVLAAVGEHDPRAATADHSRAAP